MLIAIPHLLDPAQVRRCRATLAEAPWVDGRVTAGPQAARAKHNRQLPEGCDAARELGDLILGRLEGNALFLSAALPSRVHPPVFNRYEAGMAFGNHVDNAMRPLPGRGSGRLRADLSATLFLSDPGSYDGGELQVEDTFGVHALKLGAGDLALYPASSVHRVNPVTRGERLASVFWIQSMVREDGQRALLLDLDTAIQGLGPGHAALVALTGCYHNLLRMWGDP